MLTDGQQPPILGQQAAEIGGVRRPVTDDDYIGAVIELWPRLRAPVYATPFTAGMLKAKLAEYGNSLQIPIHIIPLDSKFTVGPFGVELFSLAHLPYAEAKRLALRAFERRYLSALLERNQYNISSAARAAGVDRSNFRRLLKQYDVARSSNGELGPDTEASPSMTG